ncbi:MAG: sulfite exporter TauE/SafE family protein, partial [Candidatus Acidiferrum sp.]
MYFAISVSQDKILRASPLIASILCALLALMTILIVLCLGLFVGVMVGLLGIGGGVVLVPALVYLLHYDQHLAQGTSLFIMLPPIGLGALREYWKNGQVDLRAGICCAVGFLLGGYIGGRIAVPMPSDQLRGIFGCFMVFSAVLLWRKSAGISSSTSAENAPAPSLSAARAIGIFLAAAFSGVAAGMVGIGGGTVLVPLLALLFGF